MDGRFRDTPENGMPPSRHGRGRADGGEFNGGEFNGGALTGLPAAGVAEWLRGPDAGERGDTPPRGFVGRAAAVVRARADAWLAEREADVQVREANARIRVAEARRRLAEAEGALEAARLNARAGRAAAAVGALEAEGELRFQFAARFLPADEAAALLERAVEAERLLAEREALRRYRLTGTAAAPLPPRAGTAAEEAAARLEPAPLDDAQVRSLALRAVVRFAALGGSAAEDAWEAWRAELRRRFPPLTAAEVEAAAAELRGLSPR